MCSDEKMEPSQHAGRKPSTKGDEFQARAWFNGVANSAGKESPSELERIFQRQKGLSRIWDKYRSGVNVPSDKVNKKGQRGIALVVGDEHPETLWLLRPPLWDAISIEKPAHETLTRMIGKFDNLTTRYYQDLSSRRNTEDFDILLNLAGQSIWIDRGDYYESIDHLAVNLMMLRFDFIKFNECAHGGIATNIAKTLGPLSISPWFKNFYEEFFDYLEKNIWLDIFDNMYHPDLIDGQGWRKTRDDWLI